jgi:Nucleotide-diphospho-sugar transferase
MTMMLDYDVLFQDVDVVWYKNPLEFFQDNSTSMYDFDIYFQDDGSRGLFYAPYSANTGVYYIRSNDKTRYFFNSLLLSGDLVVSTHSHQIALVSLLTEHASL